MAKRIRNTLTNEYSIKQALYFQDKGDNKKADYIYKKIIKNDPLNHIALVNRGLLLVSKNNHQLAKELFKKATNIKSDESTYFYYLALVNKEIGLLDEAIIAFAKTVQLNPSFTAAYFNIGLLSHQLNQYDQAISYYKKSIASNDQYILAYSGLAALYIDIGDSSQAIHVFENILCINPLHVETLVSLSRIHESLSQLKKAEDYADKALTIQPMNNTAKKSKAKILRRNGNYDEAIKILLTSTSSSEQDSSDILTNAELGILFDACHNSDKAYYHFSESNRLMSEKFKSNIFDKRRYIDLIDKLSLSFNTKELEFSINSSTTFKEKSPVFLVGFPRSGTTLLDQILDSHDDIQVLEELPMIQAVIKKMQDDLGGYPDGLLSLTDTEIVCLRTIYFDVINAKPGRNSAAILVDKLPLNIIHIGLILRLFPNAKFIFALRHPCDVVLSCFMQSFTPNESMANFYTLKDSINLYVKIMSLWLRYTESKLMNFHVIKYELLVKNFDKEVKMLLNFLGVEWSNDLRQFDRHAKKRGLINTPSYSQVTQPIYQSSVNRWLRYKQYFEPFIDDIRPYLKCFSYED